MRRAAKALLALSLLVPASGAPAQETVPAQGTVPVDGPALPSLPSVQGSQRSFEDFPVAKLQGLDKITGRVSPVEVPVGGAVRFAGVEVTVRACRKTPPIEAPEAAAFLEITEAKPGEGPSRLFTGWMFASSPALSALEHPVYDIWVVDCRGEVRR